MRVSQSEHLVASCLRALLAVSLVSLPWMAPAPATAQEAGPPSFLEPCEDPQLGPGALRGDFEVFEDRAAGKGRKIKLHVLVLPATGSDPEPDPVFFLAGGPGQAATSHARLLAKSWMRRQRDIVLVDQRGTGRSNPLRVRLAGTDADLQGYLEPIFDVLVFRKAKARLETIADLTKYTTPMAMDDLDELRRVLGYEKINLVGGSYGTRASLVYIRRHPETVRTATLTGVAPIAFKNPLFHAKAAQEGFDTLVKECRKDPRYGVFANLDDELVAILERLEQSPAKVTVSHPVTNKATRVALSRDAFAEALRVMMYYMAGNRTVPLLIHRAYGGDYASFAQSGIRSNRSLRNQLAFGMLMSVVGSEDISRIRPGEIERETAGTFLGDGRVRRQKAVAGIWPRGDVPEDYGEPVRGDMPVLFISGTHDPVTPPRWGAQAARHFPNGLHVVVPAAHGTSGQDVEKLKREFLERASVKGLDTSFVDDLRMPPLRLPRRKTVIR